ncbi:MAG: hypothetical protein ACYC2H_10205 [Thermoplasmatota archaeon]
MTRRMLLRAPAGLHSQKVSMQLYAMLQAAIDNLRSFGGPATAVQLANRLRGTGLSVDFRLFERALRFGVDLEELGVVEGTRQHKTGGTTAVRMAVQYKLARLPEVVR